MEYVFSCTLFGEFMYYSVIQCVLDTLCSIVLLLFSAVVVKSQISSLHHSHRYQQTLVQTYRRNGLVPTQRDLSHYLLLLYLNHPLLFLAVVSKHLLLNLNHPLLFVAAVSKHLLLNLNHPLLFIAAVSKHLLLKLNHPLLFVVAIRMYLFLKLNHPLLIVAIQMYLLLNLNHPLLLVVAI